MIVSCIFSRVSNGSPVQPSFALPRGGAPAGVTVEDATLRITGNDTLVVPGAVRSTAAEALFQSDGEERTLVCAANHPHPPLQSIAPAAAAAAAAAVAAAVFQLFESCQLVA
jgi:hypothetical protein